MERLSWVQEYGEIWKILEIFLYFVTLFISTHFQKGWLEFPWKVGLWICLYNTQRRWYWIICFSGAWEDSAPYHQLGGVLKRIWEGRGVDLPHKTQKMRHLDIVLHSFTHIGWGGGLPHSTIFIKLNRKDTSVPSRLVSRVPREYAGFAWD